MKKKIIAATFMLVTFMLFMPKASAQVWEYNPRPGEQNWVYSAALQGDDLYISGSSFVGRNSLIGEIEKWNRLQGTNGEIVRGEYNTEILRGGVTRYHSTVVDSTGVYSVGAANTEGDQAWVMEKRDRDLGVIPGNTAVENWDIGLTEFATAAAVDETGLYIAGFESNSVPELQQWIIEKRDINDLQNRLWQTNLDIEPEFTGSDVPYGITIAKDSTGVPYTYVAGTNNWEHPERGWLFQWYMLELSGQNGEILWGNYSLYSNAMSQEPRAIVSDGNYENGYFYIAGTGYDEMGCIVERYTLRTHEFAGALDCGLDQPTAMTITLDPENPSQHIIFIVGSNSNTGWWVRKIDATTLNEVWKRETESPRNEWYYSARAVVVDPLDAQYPGLYVAGHKAHQGESLWRVEKRDIETGFLPSTVFDLTATRKITKPNNALLKWTVPGAGHNVRLSAYDIRYSTQGPIITNAEFEAARQFTGVPLPGNPGEMQQFLASGLSQLNNYWFAMRAIDENDNPSDVSNSPKVGKISSAIDSTILPLNPEIGKIDGAGATDKL